jgi:hypothetical protein
MLPGSRYAKPIMVVVTVLIILGLVATAVSYPISF